MSIWGANLLCWEFNTSHFFYFSPFPILVLVSFVIKKFNLHKLSITITAVNHSQTTRYKLHNKNINFKPIYKKEKKKAFNDAVAEE